MGLVATFTDALTRANGGLGASYTAYLGTLQIVSNLMRNSAVSTHEISHLSADAPSLTTAGDMYAKAKLTTYSDTAAYFTLWARYNVSTENGYACLFNNGTFLVQNYTAGVGTNLTGGGGSVTMSAGDTHAFECRGTSFYIYRNGTQVATGSLVQGGLTTHTTGGSRAGWGMNANTTIANLELDDLEAGYFDFGTAGGLNLTGGMQDLGGGMNG